MKRLLGVAIAILCACVASAQPSDSPPDARFDSPKRTVTTFLGALKADDQRTMRQCYVGRNEPEIALLDAILTNFRVMHQLCAAVESRWGIEAFGNRKEGESTLPAEWGVFTNHAIDLSLKLLDGWKERPKGNELTFDRSTDKPDQVQYFLTEPRLVRVRQEWKLVLEELLQEAPLGDAIKRAEMQSKVIERLAEDIKSGKFKSRTDAIEGIEKAMPRDE